MANINVTYGDMRTAAGQLSQGQADIENRLNELKAMIAGLVESGYVTDSSSKAFMTNYETFTRGATETIRGLDGMSSFLKSAADILQEADLSLARGLG